MFPVRHRAGKVFVPFQRLSLHLIKGFICFIETLMSWGPTRWWLSSFPDRRSLPMTISLEVVYPLAPTPKQFLRFRSYIQAVDPFGFDFCASRKWHSSACGCPVLPPLFAKGGDFFFSENLPRICWLQLCMFTSGDSLPFHRPPCHRCVCQYYAL